MRKNHNIKPRVVSYSKVPGKLWRKMKKHLPKDRYAGFGRPRVRNRSIMNGIWYVLWTGCQWKSIERTWFGVSSSVLHERFQTWGQQGYFAKMLKAILRYYGRTKRIQWKWQSVDIKACPSPLGGAETGKNPTDRAKLGSKIHILVDKRGAPLSIMVIGANQNEKWTAPALILAILLTRPSYTQHFCADKAYDSWEVHIFVQQCGYIDHIKHRRRVNEPKEEALPRELWTHKPKRWVVERTLSWLVRRRSIRTRWCKKPDNWLSFLQLASAHIVFDLALFG